MRILAIDSASEACSAALFDGGKVVDGFFEILGRGHAERLVPMIGELPDRGRADRILVSLGPGSFTGVRIGLAAARALGLAWQVPVAGYPTLALIAAMARTEAGVDKPVSVAVTGGHGEWFVQDFARDGLPESELVSLGPEEAAQAARHAYVAGSQADALVSLRGNGKALPLRPDARCALLLPRSLLSDRLSPLYGRGPDAKLPQKTNRKGAA
ncbi:tRNA (adenosine(37)-N6)-threonylcarbamoyltransferase complex dimerization subunit type 1 TsaB [Altericroceibacterium spongiae]|uniref:tRNA (Adenosine(37)-N6)-threonylcarbamoyltransferase complex dimerization subunit type 1 TsaB n=1 Tax=Altericroceibacterium spongiae TaxID=2320269 RepID=A0A420EMB8_9SPHN|nr:tRNA (adenosine(37)-N6)-threonylcarbamoyltransferase complex dimerization subunit type 1 TsaB [Altericroceibacterium spongiae]RKF21839.1 tRNA (adenosine(37)-N6)-threonylcarbamoyltransferase complex dimerization subunit type 1 TsaB [Altericroceibacterium spongiae]